MTKPTSLILLALLPTSPLSPASEAETLGTLRETYQAELETVETETIFKEVDLAKKYIGALDQLEQKLAGAGDLDAIVRLREEREAVEKSSETTSHDDKPLVELREKYLAARQSIRDQADASRSDITKSFTLKLQVLETELAKAGNVDTALALRKEREQLLRGLTSTIIFFDDLSEAAGTAMDGKLPDTGKAWQQTIGPPLTISGNAVDTEGGRRAIFANFTRSLEPDEILTITVTNLQTRGNFFSTGVAGYSIFVGGRGGKECTFFGDPGGSKFDSWGLWAPGGPILTSPNTTISNTATLTYNAMTGDTTLSLSHGSPNGPVLSRKIPPGLPIDSLRVATGSSGDLKFGTITAETTVAR